MDMHLGSGSSVTSFDDLIEVLCLYKCKMCHFAVSTGKADVIVHIKTEHQQTIHGLSPVNCFPVLNSVATALQRQAGNSGVSTLSEALRSRHLMLQKDGLQGTSAVTVSSQLPVQWSVPSGPLLNERVRNAVSYSQQPFQHFSQTSGPAVVPRKSSSTSSGVFSRSVLSTDMSLSNSYGEDGGMAVKEEPMSEGEEDVERFDPSWGDSEGSNKLGEEEGGKGSGQTSSAVKLKKTVSIVCPICNARLYRKTVDRHMDLHNDQGGFSCDGCDFETDQWHEMRSHMQRKHKPKHRCQNCDFETWSTEVFSEHMDVCLAEEEVEGNHENGNSIGAGHDGNGSTKMSPCQEGSENQKQDKVDEEKESASEEEFEICAECGEQLQGQDVVIHKELHNREGGFSCDRCEYKTEVWSEIKDHLNDNHKLKCQSCDFETLSESLFNKHVCKEQQSTVSETEAMSGQVQRSSETKNIAEEETNTIATDNVEGSNADNTKDTEICSVCNLELKKDSLQRHKDLHDSKGGFNCDQCDFTTADWAEMESHLATEHDGVYKCANCEFETSSEATLEDHFKNGQCAFSDKDADEDGRVAEEVDDSLAEVSMEEEENQDLEADDYEKYKDKLTSSGHCCVCGVRLYRKSVQRHMQLHNDEGGFTCPKCDFSTENWKEILKHVDWHDRVRKKFRCSKCPYSSWTKTKMQVHFRKSHSGRKTEDSLASSDHVVCPLCGVKLQPSALMAHMDSQHALSPDKTLPSPGKGEDKEVSPFVQCPLCHIKVHQKMLRKHLDMPHVQWPKAAFETPVTPSPSSQGSSNVVDQEIECPLCNKKIPSSSLRKHLDEPHPQWAQNPCNVSLQVNQGLMTIMPEKKDLQVQCPLCGMCMHRNMLTKHMKMPHVRWPQGTVSCTEDDGGGANARETTMEGEGTGNNGMASHGRPSDHDGTSDDVVLVSEDEAEMDSDVLEEDEQQGSVGHCGICGEQVSDKSVERHMLLHNDKGGFSCDKCEFSTSSWREMRTHIRNVHKEKLLCPECGFLAATVDLLRAHVSNCRDKTSAVCSICGQEVPGSQLQQHVKEAHSTVTNVMDIDLPSSLPSGKAEEHSTVNQPSVGNLLQDSSPRMLPPKKRQSVAGAHDCPICGCHLYSKTVELHIRLHDAHGGFACDLCNYVTDEWRLMRTHYNSSHSGQRNWHAALKNDM